MGFSWGLPCYLGVYDKPMIFSWWKTITLTIQVWCLWSRVGWEIYTQGLPMSFPTHPLSEALPVSKPQNALGGGLFFSLACGSLTCNLQFPLITIHSHSWLVRDWPHPPKRVHSSLDQMCGWSVDHPHPEQSGLGSPGGNHWASEWWNTAFLTTKESFQYIISLCEWRRCISPCMLQGLLHSQCFYSSRVKSGPLHHKQISHSLRW